jgi:hypothetical protein
MPPYPLVIPAGGVGPGVQVDVRAFGAKGDAQIVYDGRATGTTITSATAVFTADDVGKVLSFYNDSTNTKIHRGVTITRVVDQNTLQVSSAAATNMSSGIGVVAWGTDDTVAIQAALDFATLLTGTSTNYSENTPTGGGYATVLLSLGMKGDGAYMASDTLQVPSGVLVDCPALLISAVTGDYTKLMRFKAHSQVRRLRANCMLGNGVQLGEAGLRNQLIVSDYIRLWRVGTATSSGNRQIAFELQGYGFSINMLWSKGGNRGVMLNSANDVICHSAFIIGAITGLVAAGSSQVNLLRVLFDTCETACATINSCQNLAMTGRAFINNNRVSATQPTAVFLGDNPGTNPNANIDLDLAFQNTGGALLSLANSRDVRVRLIGSNSYLSTGNSTLITGGVSYGANLGGYMDIAQMLSAGITPIVSGTPYGTLNTIVEGTAAESLAHDVRFDASHGIAMVDRTTGQTRRLYLSNGQLALEAL